MRNDCASRAAIRYRRRLEHGADVLKVDDRPRAGRVRDCKKGVWRFAYLHVVTINLSNPAMWW
jgi:lysophospholipid acyltransferase (LPLAT)-like uncharacterized protein